MIDRYLIRYFLAVIDGGTFTAAAVRSNVSQPTLSAGIAKLERLLGKPLFHRSNQRVHLTDAGAMFLPAARRIEREFNAAEAAVKRTQAAPILRIGVLTSIPTAWIAAAMARARVADATARVELVEGSERQIIQALDSGRTDVALTLVGRGGARFLEEPLHEEGYALALPLTHPLAGEPQIAAEMLADSVMIVRRHCEALSQTSRFFIERGVRPFFALRTTNDDRTLAMVAAGLGTTVMPDGFVAEGVARPVLAGFAARRTIGLAYGAQAEGLKDASPACIVALRAAFGSIAG